MRLTLPLQKQHIGNAFKRLWKYQSALKVQEAKVPKPWVSMEIVDPILKPKTRYEPFKSPDPRLCPKVNGKEHPKWNDKVAYRFTPSTKLIEGEKQAALLCKSQVFYNLPEQLQQLTGVAKIKDQDLLVENYILQACRWDPMYERLPKLYDRERPNRVFRRQYGITDRRKSHVIIHNLARLASTLAGQYPEFLQQRQHIHNSYFSCPMENMGDLILINGTVHIHITSKKCLPAFATDAEVTASENHHLADIFPLKQTIDLSKENIYTAEEQIGLAGRTDSHPHTLLTRNPHYTYIDSQLNSKAMMHCMAHCIIEAHRMYGADVKQLPQPITVQHIGVNHTGQVFYFTAFQLNTLDFSSHDGVKNFTWFDGGNELFSDITKDGNVVGYNPEVFKKVLAFYLNGL